MRRAVALLVCISLLVTGCASYTTTTMAVPGVAEMRAQKAESDVFVGADPFVQAERQKAVFDADLGGEDVIPVRVLVRNDSGRRLLVRPSSMTLALPDGAQIPSAGATAVAAKLDQGVGEVIGWGIAFGIIGMLAASANKDSVRAARLQDYRSKELPEVSLAKGESAHGFVFFIPPRGTKPFSGAALSVRFVDVAEGTSFDVRLPLSGLGFKGVPAGAEEIAKAAAAGAGAAGTATASAVAGRGSGDVQGLLGIWRGLVRNSLAPGPTYPVTLRIFQDQGQALWVMEWAAPPPSATHLGGAGPPETLKAAGSATVSGDRLTLSGAYDRESGTRARTRLNLSLTLKGEVLEGTGFGEDNRFFTVSATRSR